MTDSCCHIDQQPNHWFQCALGTVGCPRIHNGRTPHCIKCTNGEPCEFHDEPALEMSAEEYYARQGEEPITIPERNSVNDPPTCPHCGDTAPYGDARHVWLRTHIDSYIHRWWWKLKAWYSRMYGGW